jgi:hypothetical protein
MALIRTNRLRHRNSAVFEDPRPGGNRIYFWNNGHKRDDLSHIFDSSVSHNVAGNNLTDFGFPSLRGDSTWRHAGVLMVTGEVVHCQHVSVINNDAFNNLDLCAFISMDPDNKASNHRFIQSSGAISAVYSYTNNFQVSNSTGSSEAQTRLDISGELDSTPPTKFLLTGTYNSWALYFNPATGNLIQLANALTSGAIFADQQAPGRILNVTAGPAAVLTYQNIGVLSGIMYQFIGIATDGNALFLNNSVANDHTQIITKYTDVSNTGTTLHTFNAVPSAAGTSAGGNRATAFGNTNIKLSSRTFLDVGSTTNRAWYTPYFDVNGRFHPFYFQWNRSTDIFTRNSDITVNWPSGTTQDDYWLADTISLGQNGTAHKAQRPWYNESFTITNGEVTTRYLTLFQFHGSGTVHNDAPLRRSFVTFTVNANDPKELTYHSHVIIPETPKNIVWLNDDLTLFGIFAWNNFYIYRFGQTSGWALISTQPYSFDAVGRDSLGRIWAVDGGPLLWGRLHVFTSEVPTTISVELADVSYNYTGTPIDTTATVNAFNVSGDRMTAEVTLKVEGSSLKLINSSDQEVSELTVTTSSSQDTEVDVRIIGAGTSNIVASVNV